MIYGYARVSAQDQNLDTQIEQLLKYGIDKIVKEKISGVSQEKIELDHLLSQLIKGDTLVVTRMDRLGRNTIQLLQFIEHLHKKGVHFAVLNLGIDTRTPTGKFFLTVMSAFSELDREMIKEKQIAGIKLAKQKGVYRGRIKKYTEQHAGMNHAIELRQQTKKTIKEICAITGVSQAALYRKLKELKKDDSLI
ncbi:resolvase [Bacillus thuringiensis serovar medellin]|uniref:Resolvase n=1 Tax=Bacillus thuringiensis subsp. medellin TaxID=79672 RepID=A0A9X6RGY6_BACTV|nr:recombinase family protein [Bacillus thuringiensis]OUB93538.1 resolvase [Bacillus thuringiensis serovar medellin]OUB94189.1 resolvase [Bacillus thuringiensis serovar medellin]OUC01033.1 resolvase [Bacillus thuringiensis serovar medellin]OUC01231.1 resolvase [Bacillus thuringiensis serovar medellin]OUC01245.1 resolvase [Bacillus thuringiensis serovar medellin]